MGLAWWMCTFIFIQCRRRKQFLVFDFLFCLSSLFLTHCIDVIVEISSGYIWMRHIKVTSCLVKHLRQYVKHITVSQIWSPLNSHDPFFLSFEYVMIIWLFQCPPLSVSVTSCFTNIMQISSRCCCSYHIWGDNRGLCLCPLNKEGSAGSSSCFKQIDGM